MQRKRTTISFQVCWNKNQHFTHFTSVHSFLFSSLSESWVSTARSHLSKLNYTFKPGTWKYSTDADTSHHLQQNCNLNLLLTPRAILFLFMLEILSDTGNIIFHLNHFLEIFVVCTAWIKWINNKDVFSIETCFAKFVSPPLCVFSVVDPTSQFIKFSLKMLADCIVLDYLFHQSFKMTKR